jgi:hypothetical protein
MALLLIASMSWLSCHGTDLSWLYSYRIWPNMLARSRKKPKTYLESEMVRVGEMMKTSMSVRVACNV